MTQYGGDDMTNAELKEALEQEYPVICKGVKYARVSAIIYRKGNGRIVVSAELLDKGGKSVTIAAARNVSKGEKHEV